MIKPIILAGGKGTRLWPASSPATPKQFLSLSANGVSLLQETVQRLSRLKAVEPPLIICNQNHLSLCEKQLSKSSAVDSQYITEPFGKNTAPALMMAALYCLEYLNTDSILLILPADHWIADNKKFCDCVEEAAVLASKNSILTFGIKPSAPHTGYGYIQTKNFEKNQNVKKILSFKEKPDKNVAEIFFNDENYYWNSGIFMAKASVFVSETKKHAKILYETVSETFKKSEIIDGIFKINAELFSKCPDISFDHAIMEKTDVGLMLPLQSDWSDLGCWSAVSQFSKGGISGNCLKGNVITHKTKSCYIQTDSKTIATIGIENMVIINSQDGILIGSKDHMASMKEVVKELELIQVKNERPWGHYECMLLGEGYQVKRLTINPGARLSLQLHHHRAETWVVVSGEAEVTLGDKLSRMKKNESIFVPIGVEHRVENCGESPLIIIETQTGDYLGEDDIVRLEDDYGRK